MLKRIILPTLIIILIVIDLFLLQLYSKEKQKPKEINFVDKKSVSETISFLIKTQECKIDTNLLIINECSDTIKINEVIDNTSLIFYYNQFNCMPCVDETLEILKNKVSNYNIQNFIVHDKNYVIN